MNHETKARQRLAERLRLAASRVLDHSIPLTEIVNVALHDESGIVDDGYTELTTAAKDMLDNASEYALARKRAGLCLDERILGEIRITCTLTLTTALEDIEQEIEG
jgi:hypothetical protein